MMLCKNHCWKFEFRRNGMSPFVQLTPFLAVTSSLVSRSAVTLHSLLCVWDRCMGVKPLLFSFVYRGMLTHMFRI